LNIIITYNYEVIPFTLQQYSFNLKIIILCYVTIHNCSSIFIRLKLELPIKYLESIICNLSVISQMTEDLFILS
jgi:hypothetical protein